jgi:hypothetical protein
VADRPKRMANRPSVVAVPKQTWWECYLELGGGVVDLSKSVAWDCLAGRPCGGRPVGNLALPASNSAKAPTYFTYKIISELKF